MQAPSIRTATPADVPAITRIYQHYVDASVATFDTAAPPDGYWQATVASAEPGDHVIVTAVAGRILGYAYSTAFRPRPGYSHTRETSVYLAPESVGRGLGTKTYRHLLSLLRADGTHCAVAVVAEPNPASVALHESLGFTLMGTLHEVGRKFGRWIDTRWYQLILDVSHGGA